MPRWKACSVTLALLALVLSPATAYAHGFGERYELPVPLGLYVAGAGAAVLLSFVATAGVMAGRGARAYPRLNLLTTPIVRWLAHRAILATVRALFVGAFILYLVAGLFGTENPNRNLAPTATWVLLWVGLAYFSAFIGNLWALINPWRTMFGWAEALYGRMTGGRHLARNEPYPSELASWPAVVLFFLFAWVEVVYEGSSVPFDLAALALLYTAFTLGAMFWFGRDVWLRRGEMFSVLFGFLATLAPLHVASSRSGRAWNLRPWGAGLLDYASRPRRVRISLSQAAFIVLLLSTVTFDGFSETPVWTDLLTEGYQAFSFLGPNAITLVETLGLLATPLLFFSAFALAAALMRPFAASRLSTLNLVRAFAPSLIPIAVAYHVAHFAGYLMINGQRMVFLVSNPFGYDWDLFGTADYVVNAGAVTGQWVWAVSVAAIVIGHVVAVYAAHAYAVRLFPDRRRALLSQIPMVALMVGYTMVSLWIVAQPIVGAEA